MFNALKCRVTLIQNDASNIAEDHVFQLKRLSIEERHGDKTQLGV